MSFKTRAEDRETWRATAVPCDGRQFHQLPRTSYGWPDTWFGARR